MRASVATAEGEVMAVQPTSEQRTVGQLSASAALAAAGMARMAVVTASIFNTRLIEGVDVDFISLSINRAVLTVICFSGSSF